MAARTGKQGWKALESFPGKQHLESHRGKAAVICITQGGTPLGCILAGVGPWAAACPPPVPFQEQTAPCIPDKENGFTQCSVDDGITLRLLEKSCPSSKEQEIEIFLMQKAKLNCHLEIVLDKTAEFQGSRSDVHWERDELPFILHGPAQVSPPL